MTDSNGASRPNYQYVSPKRSALPSINASVAFKPPTTLYDGEGVLSDDDDDIEGGCELVLEGRLSSIRTKKQSKFIQEIGFMDPGWDITLDKLGLLWHRVCVEEDPPPLSFAVKGGRDLLHVSLQSNSLMKLSKASMKESTPIGNMKKITISSNKTDFSIGTDSGHLEYSMETAADCEELVICLRLVQLLLEDDKDVKSTFVPPFESDVDIGIVCIHRGHLQKRGKTLVRYSNRYVWIVRGRALVFKDANAVYPLNAIRLSTTDVRQTSDDEFELHAKNRLYHFRCLHDDIDKWITAFGIEKQAQSFYDKHKPRKAMKATDLLLNHASFLSQMFSGHASAPRMKATTPDAKAGAGKQKFSSARKGKEGPSLDDIFAPLCSPKSGKSPRKSPRSSQPSSPTIAEEDASTPQSSADSAGTPNADDEEKIDPFKYLPSSTSESKTKDKKRRHKKKNKHVAPKNYNFSIPSIIVSADSPRCVTSAVQFGQSEIAKPAEPHLSVMEAVTNISLDDLLGETTSDEGTPRNSDSKEAPFNIPRLSGGLGGKLDDKLAARGESADVLSPDSALSPRTRSKSKDKKFGFRPRSKSKDVKSLLETKKSSETRKTRSHTIGITSVSPTSPSGQLPAVKEDHMTIDRVEELALPKTYFSFVQNNIHNFSLYTVIPTPDHWLKQSEVAMLHRAKRTRTIDMKLKDYHESLSRINRIIKTSRILVQERDVSGSQNEIAFAFPSFESQNFMVGTNAAIEPYNFFTCSGDRAWSDETWRGALQAASVAKELMQSSPNLNRYYDEDRMEEAKEIMREDQKQLLHNLSIASFFRNELHRVGDALSNRIQWQRMLDNAGSRNKLILNDEFTYIFNPDNQQLRTMNPDRERVLTEPLIWLAIFKTLQESRLSVLLILFTDISNWKAEHDVKKNRSSRADAIDELVNTVQFEVNNISSLLKRLPERDALKQLHEKTSTFSSQYATKTPQRKRAYSNVVVGKRSLMAAHGIPAPFTIAQRPGQPKGLVIPEYESPTSPTLSAPSSGRARRAQRAHSSVETRQAQKTPRGVRPRRSATTAQYEPGDSPTRQQLNTRPTFGRPSSEPSGKADSVDSSIVCSIFEPRSVSDHSCEATKLSELRDRSQSSGSLETYSGPQHHQSKSLSPLPEGAGLDPPPRTIDPFGSPEQGRRSSVPSDTSPQVKKRHSNPVDLRGFVASMANDHADSPEMPKINPPPLPRNIEGDPLATPVHTSRKLLEDDPLATPVQPKRKLPPIENPHDSNYSIPDDSLSPTHAPPPPPTSGGAPPTNGGTPSIASSQPPIAPGLLSEAPRTIDMPPPAFPDTIEDHQESYEFDTIPPPSEAPPAMPPSGARAVSAPDGRRDGPQALPASDGPRDGPRESFSFSFD